ncbi:hypothetical protein JIX56_05100 [Streptomyces sp. CA-210063]|uniref:hypothetical protein n=1 Tax=Streptomyces sp. CA-210063 TaxID=2801029 RepID=UPI00214C3786|nr:hypothetical protein [Streptomyces sp. CA-210063]UUU29321.1 hypothetical protein JIX56_05100 [Streptomyces sp. CA-210063]
MAGTDGPLQDALTHYYGALVEWLGRIAAASRLMSLFALTAEEDRVTAARTVLTHRAR